VADVLEPEVARRQLTLDFALLDRARHVVVEMVGHSREAGSVHEQRQLRSPIADPDDPYGPIPVTVRIDTPTEAAYYEHGGILQYVLRQHLASANA
jgi:aconitase A